MKTNFFKVLCATAIGLFGCSDDQNPIDKTTVNSLDLTRYMGKWYEIARYDHSFEHGLVGCTAHYTLQNDGTVKVVNAGYKNTLDGKYTETAGKARRPNAQVPGKLEVAFFANFYADYWVLELDENYTYALIGSKKDKYLWILSRTPEMESEDLNWVLDRAKSRGYNLDDLIWVAQ